MREDRRQVLGEIDNTIAEFRGDPNRVYLSGFSMGASGAYRMTARCPKRFAALVTVARLVEAQNGWGSEKADIDRRTNTYVNAPDAFAARAERIHHIPIMIFHGETDGSIPVEQSRRLFAALKKIGADAHYTEYPDTHHGPAAEKAYADPTVIDWLLSHRRKSSP